MDQTTIIGSVMVLVAVAGMGYPKLKSMFSGGSETEENVPDGIDNYVASIVEAAGDEVDAETVLAYISAGMRPSQVARLQAGVHPAKTPKG